MNKIKFLSLLLFVLAGSLLFAQSDKKSTSVKYESPEDFRIISSNSSYIEFELYQNILQVSNF